MYDNLTIHYYLLQAVSAKVTMSHQPYTKLADSHSEQAAVRELPLQPVAATAVPSQQQSATIHNPAIAQPQPVAVAQPQAFFGQPQMNHGSTAPAAFVQLAPQAVAYMPVSVCACVWPFYWQVL